MQNGIATVTQIPSSCDPRLHEMISCDRALWKVACAMPPTHIAGRRMHVATKVLPLVVGRKQLVQELAHHNESPGNRLLAIHRRWINLSGTERIGVEPKWSP